MSGGVRIWMTGAGLVTPLGATRDETWVRLVRGDRAIERVRLFETEGQRSEIAAEVRGLVLPEPPPGEVPWSRTGAMALQAMREAAAQAELDLHGARRIGLVVGATTGGMFETEALLAGLHARPGSRDLLRGMLTHPLTSTGDRVDRVHGRFARIRTLCSACSSGANALIVAATWLLAGVVDAVVAGGSDGLCRLTFTGFNALGAVDREPCRPFDRRRRGLSLGEGAGFVVLERAAQARTRGREPLAELAGWALGAEAHHITNPEPKGDLVAGLMTRALAGAGLAPSALDYVNAHGTGTPLNDPMEAVALSRALGAEIERVPVSSSKAQIGHALSAAGAIEGVVAALAISRQTLVPTAGLDEPDPACALVHVPHRGRPARVRASMSNSLGFGGMDSVLVFTEPELGPPKQAAAREVVVTGLATLTPRGLAGAADAHLTLTPEGQLAAPPPSAAVPLPALDPMRARRLDHPSQLGAIIVERAIADAGAAGLEAGVVLGSAFGNVDASAAFMHRVFERGARFASPAEFPNLVPSSPVGHVSIYLGLRGPAFSTADLATSGESAIVQAIELVEAGIGERVIGGAACIRSDIEERALLALFARSKADLDAPRAEGAAAIVIESEDAARARGARLLARVAGAFAWRDGSEPALPSPRDVARACVVLPRENGGIEGILAGTGWRAVPRWVCAASTGEHDGLGAVAVGAAVSRLAAGHADSALVCGLSKGRGYALVLESAR